MSKRIILAISGEMGSGKGTVARYFRDLLGFSMLQMSHILRDILKERGMECTREKLALLSTELRREQGEDVLSRMIADEVRGLEGNVVVHGIRRESGIQHLQEMGGFYLIHVEAPSEVRYARLVARAENPGDVEKSWEQFQEEHRSEAESRVSELRALADFVIQNDGDIERLYEQLDRMMEKIVEKEEGNELRFVR